MAFQEGPRVQVQGGRSWLARPGIVLEETEEHLPAEQRERLNPRRDEGRRDPGGESGVQALRAALGSLFFRARPVSLLPGTLLSAPRGGPGRGPYPRAPAALA